MQRQFRRLIQLHDPAIDPGADKPLRAQPLDKLHMLALAPLHHRGQQQQPFLGGALQDLIDHLRHGLRLQPGLMPRAMRLPDAGEQQPEVIIYFGDGADRRARVVRGGLLLYGDGRRQPLDMIHIRFFHHR